MPEKNYGIINGSEPVGKPDVAPIVNATDDTPKRSFGPQIINGFEDPADTERIGDGVKRTRSGAIDRRTLRGSARGSSEAPAKESVHLSTIDIPTVLYSLHVMAAGFTKVAELELSKDEAKKLGDAITEVSKHYAVEFDPKKVALFHLATTAGGIYGAHFIRYRMRAKLERETARPKVTGPQPVPSPAQPKPNGAPAAPASPSAIFGEVQDGSL